MSAVVVQPRRALYFSTAVVVATRLAVGCGSSESSSPNQAAGAAGVAGAGTGASSAGGTSAGGTSAGGSSSGGAAASGGAAGAPNGNLLFVGDFESGNLDKWSFSGNTTTQVIKSPVRAGQFAALMVVSPQDAVPYRSELTVKGDAGTFHDGTEYWIGLSFRIDDWGVDLPQWATLFQTHATPHALAGGGFDWTCGAGKDSISVTTAGAKMALNVVVNPDQSQPPSSGAIATGVWSEPLQIGTWIDWVFRYRPSTGKDGILEAWMNGKKLYSQMGANRYQLDKCGLPSAPQTYLKAGIYRDKTNTSTQRLDYDEVRIFSGTNGYSAVAPK